MSLGRGSACVLTACIALPLPLLFLLITVLQEAHVLYYLSQTLCKWGSPTWGLPSSLALTMPVIVTSLCEPPMAILFPERFRTASDLTKSALVNRQTF